MGKQVIIRNLKTGQEETVDAQTAERLQSSKYAQGFEFRPIIEPTEVSEADGGDTEGAETE